MQDFEKLGLFYLGRSYDVTKQDPGNDLILYDSRDLLTHAICVGMTGSGKTGLCLSLLEEAAIDRVPAIAIDPKGDLSNLLLTFPKLRGQDFEPWVDSGEAEKQGLSAAEFAEKQASIWKTGLAEWGQDGARIERLRQSAEFRIYTPGSQAGIPISILKSFAAPKAEIRDDPENLNDRVGTAASSLLGLLGIQADPSQSCEHILLSNILATAWKAGTDLDIGSLIPQIQNPPFSRIGVIELESFFPANDRFAFAMRLNNMMAAPGFETWTKGEPLDIDTLFHASDGKPRISIISIAHLADTERMFFVSLLLNQVLGWVRTQTGTTSLRAILYMDEIYGFFPPVAMPPSKRPLLTLMKQARAFGLGIVLATQNPADLDYKGLANAGTWFLGRLQAERDKLRVLEGLEGAAAEQSARFDRQEMDKLLSGLAKRTFLMHNVHDDQPQVLQVRWALSYLRGPLTRQQIKQLMDPVKGTSTKETKPEEASAENLAVSAASKESSAAVDRVPLLPPEVPQFFIPLRSNPPKGAKLLYRPMLLGCADVFYNDTKTGVSATKSISRLAPLSSDALTVDWTEAKVVEITPDDLEKEPADAAKFATLPPTATKAKSYATWSKSLIDALYRGETLSVLKSPTLGQYSDGAESERDFRVRLQQAAKEARDARLDQLRAKYAPKLSALEEKIRKAEQAVEREAAQARHAGFSSLVRFGTTILSAVMGRKTLSASTINKAGTAIRGAGDTWKQSGDVSRAKETAESLHAEYDALEAEYQAESKALELKLDSLTEPLETIALKPKKTNITTKLVALAWTPNWTTGDGSAHPAWQ